MLIACGNRESCIEESVGAPDGPGEYGFMLEYVNSLKIGFTAVSRQGMVVNLAGGNGKFVSPSLED